MRGAFPVNRCVAVCSGKSSGDEIKRSLSRSTPVSG